MSAVAAQLNKSTRRSPCGDSEQCEYLKQNGERWEGQKWQLQILEEQFLEGQSLVGLALTSNSGLKLDQVRHLNSILHPNLNFSTGGAAPASEKPEAKPAPVKELPRVEVPEDQDRAITDHQQGVCPPDRQVFYLASKHPLKPF